MSTKSLCKVTPKMTAAFHRMSIFILAMGVFFCAMPLEAAQKKSGKSKKSGTSLVKKKSSSGKSKGGKKKKPSSSSPSSVSPGGSGGFTGSSDSNGSLSENPTPSVSLLEVITEDACDDISNGGNAWGGHQCRIVRTKDGVFTAYTISGNVSYDQDGNYDRKWCLAHREGSKWTILAQGPSGREPVNLLAGPDGTLHIVAWPSGNATLWSGKLSQGNLIMKDEIIPGMPFNNWPYGSAGIDAYGNIFVLSSEGSAPGGFRWAVKKSDSGQWETRESTLDFRHCYTYVMPDNKGGVNIVSTRDCTWEKLGYAKPEGVFAYAFNAFGFFRTPNINSVPLQRLAVVKEEPTNEYPAPLCNAQNDALVDKDGRVHILYRKNGYTTHGNEELRHAIFSDTGNLIADTKLPSDLGILCRIIQDDMGRFYIIGDSGLLYSVGDDGRVLGRSSRLNLAGNKVEYSGFGLAAPRTGSPTSNFIDAVFPSNGGKKWIYCCIVLSPSPDPTLYSEMVSVAGGKLPQLSGLAEQGVSSFQIRNCEVTWGEWREVRDWAEINNKGYDLTGVGETYPSRSGDDFPVINVSWYDVVKWCNAKSEKEGLTPVYRVNGTTYKTGNVAPTVNASANGYRLPSEKEWEWAARGGVSSKGYTYSGSNVSNDVAWTSENSSDGTKAVGAKAANELGIYDMSGNVYEWCEDVVYNSLRRFRGGGWQCFLGGDAAVASRGYELLNPDDRFISIGFRIARNSN